MLKLNGTILNLVPHWAPPIQLKQSNDIDEAFGRNLVPNRFSQVVQMSTKGDVFSGPLQSPPQI